VSNIVDIGGASKEQKAFITAISLPTSQLGQKNGTTANES
jgi:hypothetical protein